MATKAKKNTKIKIEKNEEVLDEPIPLMALEEEGEAKIEELPGVGPATAEKLLEAGFDYLLSLAVMAPGDLAERAE